MANHQPETDGKPGHMSDEGDLGPGNARDPGQLPFLRTTRPGSYFIRLEARATESLPRLRRQRRYVFTYDLPYTATGINDSNCDNSQRSDFGYCPLKQKTIHEITRTDTNWARFRVVPSIAFVWSGR